MTIIPCNTYTQNHRTHIQQHVICAYVKAYQYVRRLNSPATIANKTLKLQTQTTQAFLIDQPLHMTNENIE